jgi:hypothetical protein
MRCPNCKGDLQKLFEVECGNTMTLPVEQIMHVKPTSPEFIERLESEPKPSKRKKREPKIKAVKPIVKQFIPPNLVTIQKAQIKLYWCPNCRIFVKAVE